MQSLFSTTTSQNTFDTALNFQNYSSYNERYKDTKNSLTEDIFEPQMLNPPEDMQIDYQNNYNKEITVNPQKDDITKRVQNISDMQIANKYNAFTVGKGVSQLEKEQKVGRTEELMQGHVQGIPGGDTMHNFTMQKANQNTQQAQRDAQKAFLMRTKFLPHGVDNGAFMNEDPDYYRIKHARDTSLKQRFDLTNYRDMQRYGEFDWRKRQMVPVKFLGNGYSQIKYGDNRPQQYVLTARKNKMAPQYQRNTFQREADSDQILEIDATKLLQLNKPLDAHVRQLLATQQFSASGQLVNDKEKGRLVHYDDKYFNAPVGVQFQSVKVLPSSRGGTQLSSYKDKPVHQNINRAINYQTPAYAPYATNIQTQAAQDQAFRVAAQIAHDHMVYGAENIGFEQNIGEIV